MQVTNEIVNVALLLDKQVLGITPEPVVCICNSNTELAKFLI